MRCNDYFDYFDDNNKLSYSFGFYSYDYDWEKPSNILELNSNMCVIVHGVDKKVTCIIPIVNNKVMFSALSSSRLSKNELPDGLIKTISKIYKNKAFL